MNILGIERVRPPVFAIIAAISWAGISQATSAENAVVSNAYWHSGGVEGFLSICPRQADPHHSGEIEIPEQARVLESVAAKRSKTT